MKYLNEISEFIKTPTFPQKSQLPFKNNKKKFSQKEKYFKCAKV